MFVQLLETRRFLRMAQVNVRHSIDMRSSRGLEESCRHVATFLQFILRGTEPTAAAFCERLIIGRKSLRRLVSVISTYAHVSAEVATTR